MAELEIDQSHLPRVQEVCQSFSVLEDGVLAHNLQEQEIEQYYTTNIQKNQLVQNDIRMAKRLQDEEQQRAQQSVLHRQASRQIEEQDFEYARVIQEEIQRCDEEAWRREQDDEEIAKRMQEEEEQRIRRSSRELEGHSESTGNASGSPQQGEEQFSSTSTRGQYGTSHSYSETPPQRTTAKGHRGSTGHTESEVSECLSDDSEDLETVLREELSVWSQRHTERHNTAPLRRQMSLHHPQERNYRSLCSHHSFPEELRGWEEERVGREWDEVYCENGDPERRRARNRYEDRNHRQEYDGWHRNRSQHSDSRAADVGERRCSRSESVSLHDRHRQYDRDLAQTWTFKDNIDKHVRFQDDGRSSNSHQDDCRVWEMLGQVLKERGVPVRFGAHGAPLQIRPQSRDGSEVSWGEPQPHQRSFQRASTTRHSFHGDIRERRRSSYRDNRELDHRADADRRHNNMQDNGFEVRSLDWDLTNGERRGSREWRGHRYAHDEKERLADHRRVRRATSDLWDWQETTEEKFNSEVKTRERIHHRVPLRSQTFSSHRATAGDRSRHAMAGALLQPEVNRASLDMGELQQVLQDEELARKLQEEEESLLRRSSPTSSYPPGDFRVAQVAQDEEIARFMQKQEIKSKRRSRELEGPASWREHRAMISHHERRAARERQIQRERLDSEGLPSPSDDFPPENLPPSPVCTTPPAQQIRNIAEELDPTFQARRQGTDSLQMGQPGPTCQPLPVPPSDVHDFLEPTFVPPTKRQSEKAGRTKTKEKKEACKQQ
ncbi:coiled-coil domain-containing protein 187 isoform X2 [Thalassophryne amazonica]|uniref:coiled-coil domain-containing protein 187 isoform X2 n=1 Tax=Thalassophryne amazonica TaxID=390379 RepID=UPI0014708E31|nr:coiled-coil domain-containing protein 187 isoform X2 [Thalassophryne amazonica]